MPKDIMSHALYRYQLAVWQVDDMRGRFHRLHAPTSCEMLGDLLKRNQHCPQFGLGALSLFMLDLSALLLHIYKLIYAYKHAGMSVS